MSMVFAPCLTETAAPTTHAQPAWSPYDNNGGWVLFPCSLYALASAAHGNALLSGLGGRGAAQTRFCSSRQASSLLTGGMCMLCVNLWNFTRSNVGKSLCVCCWVTVVRCLLYGKVFGGLRVCLMVWDPLAFANFVACWWGRRRGVMFMLGLWIQDMCGHRWRGLLCNSCRHKNVNRIQHPHPQLFQNSPDVSIPSLYFSVWQHFLLWT